jgi:hypothetical protein
MAKIAAFIDDAGPLKPNGSLWSAAEHLAVLERAHERREDTLEATYGHEANRPTITLSQIAAELTEAREHRDD